MKFRLLALSEHRYYSLVELLDPVPGAVAAGGGHQGGEEDQQEDAKHTGLRSSSHGINTRLANGSLNAWFNCKRIARMYSTVVGKCEKNR